MQQCGCRWCGRIRQCCILQSLPTSPLPLLQISADRFRANCLSSVLSMRDDPVVFIAASSALTPAMQCRLCSRAVAGSRTISTGTMHTDIPSTYYCCSGELELPAEDRSRLSGQHGGGGGGGGGLGGLASRSKASEHPALATLQHLRAAHQAEHCSTRRSSAA